MRVPEVTHGFGWAAALLPRFALLLVLLAVGACGYRAHREAAETDDAWETSLGGYYGARGTLGGHREPEEEAKGALRMGRASFSAAPAWVGRGAVSDGLSQPGQSI